MKLEIVQLKYMLYKHQLHKLIYSYTTIFFFFFESLLLKLQFLTALYIRTKVFRSGALLVSTGKEFQLEIAHH